VPQPYYADDDVTLHLGDCLTVLATLPDASVDAVVTDPPVDRWLRGRPVNLTRAERVEAVLAVPPSR